MGSSRRATSTRGYSHNSRITPVNTEQLKTILAEYPMSMRLVVTVEKQEVLATTVIEMLLKLIPLSPDALLNFCGRDICIIREHVEEPLLGEKALRKEWLEMDMR
jgi:hypothetical protein